MGFRQKPQFGQLIAVGQSATDSTEAAERTTGFSQPHQFGQLIKPCEISPSLRSHSVPLPWGEAPSRESDGQEPPLGSC